jgi:hypothetical protein
LLQSQRVPSVLADGAKFGLSKPTKEGDEGRTFGSLDVERSGEDPRALDVEPFEREARVEFGGRKEFGMGLDEREESVGVLLGSFFDTDLACRSGKLPMSTIGCEKQLKRRRKGRTVDRRSLELLELGLRPEHRRRELSGKNV